MTGAILLVHNSMLKPCMRANGFIDIYNPEGYIILCHQELANTIQKANEKRPQTK